MKNVKYLSLVVLVCSVLLFAGYNWKMLKSKDSLGPVIEMDEEVIYVSVKDGEDALLQGMTATDARDGDVTESLVVESISDFTEDKKRYVNYAAFDSDYHVSKTFRKMVYTDYTPIHFSLEAPLQFPASNNTQDILGVVHAEDCVDGDLTDRINFSSGSEILLYSPSDYEVELQVSNSMGDTATLPVTVTIYDNADYNAAPQICLSDYLVYTKVGKSITPASYLEGVVYRTVEYGMTEERGTFCVDTSEMGREELAAFKEEQEENPTVSYERIQIRDHVDYQTPGVYEIQYSLEDDDSNVGKVNLVVVVEEE